MTNELFDEYLKSIKDDLFLCADEIISKNQRSKELPKDYSVDCIKYHVFNFEEYYEHYLLMVYFTANLSYIKNNNSIKYDMEDDFIFAVNKNNATFIQFQRDETINDIIN